MNDKNMKNTKELIKYMTTEELEQKLSEHNTQVYSEDIFQLIRNELEARQKAVGKSPRKSGNGLKEVLFVIILIGLLLIATNPTKAEYAEYLTEQSVQQQNIEDFITSENYLFLTVFKAKIARDDFRAIGILKKFISLE